MDHKMLARVSKYLQEHRRCKKWRRFVRILAAVVVFCTTYALILPAITLEYELVCGKEEHTHTDECYTDEIRLICSQEEMTGHTHTDACYQTEYLLICGQEESEEHTHSDTCYQMKQTLICGQEETAGHTHTDACYQTEHLLTCEKEEHTHSSDCYAEEKELTETASSSDSAADVEDKNDWEDTLKDVTLTGDWPVDVLAVAESQLGYTESKKNFVVDENGKTRGYTRYGAWYGDSYGHWCAMFVSFCLNYAEVEGIPLEANCEQWITKLSSEEYHLYHSADTYQPQPGDLVFFDISGEGTSDHVGLVKEIIPAAETTPAALKTIEGNSSDRVQYVTYEMTDSKIIGYGQLPRKQEKEVQEAQQEEPALTGQTYTYEDDKVVAEVTLPADSVVPADAVLSVHPIADTDDSYSKLTRQAEGAVSGAVEEIILYDISFYTSADEYIPVADSATVHLRFKEAVLAERDGDVAVLHYESDENAPVALQGVDVEKNENDTLAAVTFRTEGFSIYAVVNVGSSTYQRITDVNNLDGKSAAILSNSANYAMMGTATSDNNGLAAQSVASVNDLSSYTFWTFEKNTDGTFYIRNGDNYLVMGTQTLNTTTTKSQASKFSVTIANGLAEIGASVNGTSYYVNLFGGEGSPSGFKSYTDSSGNLQQLYVKTDNESSGMTITDLGGKSFVIANLNTAARPYAMTSTPNGNGYLTAAPVSILSFKMSTEDDNTYVSGGDITLWHFAGTDTEGAYYIQAEDTGKYLHLESGALTVSDTPQEIAVTTNDTYPGQVRLSADNTAVDWHGGSNPNNLVFGPYNGTNQNDYQTLCKVIDNIEDGLIYDLNVPNLSISAAGTGKGTTWQNTPSLDSSIQYISESQGRLLAQPGGYFEEAGTAGIPDLYRYNIRVMEEMVNEPAYTEGVMKDTWYGEERFDGWEYTDSEGQTHLLPAEAEITRIQTDGVPGFQVTDCDGSSLFLPAGTVLKGKWTEVSSVVTFFVNYKGTILDTEGDVTGRRSDTFTKAVAVGHVFYGKLKAGDDQTFGTEANAMITEAFSPEFADQFDEKNPKTQIVIEYMRECTVPSDTGTDYETSLQVSAHGANGKAVEADTLQLLKETGRTIQVATGDTSSPNPTIDNALCDTEHYQIRWYVMKEQNDAWHIDGVLVAKTAEIAVTKTFSGLTEAEVSELLGSTGETADKTKDFQIDVTLGETLQEYLDITNRTVQGQYEYAGAGNANLPNSHSWTFHAITDELYAFSEENYGIEGYDVSSIVVHYYKNSQTGMEQIEYTYGDSTQDFEDAAGRSVVGGQTTAVSFNNFYTNENTGAMIIVKREKGTSDNTVYGRLQGAEFTLYQNPECTESYQVNTTNANGAAYFSDLAIGEYYLKETEAPEGYTPSNKTWKVKVEEDEDSKIVVRLYELDSSGQAVESGTLLYEGGIQGSYTVYNEADTSTVTVTKTFSGLTNVQLDAMVKESVKDEDGNVNPEGYYISLRGSIGGNGIIEGNGGSFVDLCLSEAQRSMDNMSFTWTIYDLAITQKTDGESKPIPYTLTEYNYLLDDYADTVVTADLDGEEQNNISIDRDLNYAAVSRLQFQPSSSDHITLRNHYTNTFTLKLTKVDSVSGEPVKDAVFSIYGPYDEAADVNDRITYTDETGKENTAFFIKNITTDENGIAEQSGLRLSKGENTFVYRMKESGAPEGYVQLERLVVATVTVDTENYSGGVFTVEAPNTKEREVIQNLTTSKLWEPDVPAGKEITLELYRVAHAERNVALAEVVDAEPVQSVTLDGTADQKPEGEEISAYESAPWVAVWLNIPAAEEGENAAHYHYFVRELTKVEGYDTSYECYEVYAGEKADVPLSVSDAEQTLQVTHDDGTTETFDAYLMADMAEDYTVEITNSVSEYELPESGGPGTLWITIGGILLMAGSLLYGYRLRRRRERRSRY